MSTKQNPGQFNCYELAAPDEPMFVLLARDPAAPFLVDLWVALRTGDQGLAAGLLREAFARQDRKPTHADQLAEALQCSTRMNRWRKGMPDLPAALPEGEEEG